MEKPFAAYTGRESYAFVCYAHEDAEAVYAEIEFLDNQGTNIWYDEGVTTGEEWTEELAKAILDARYFLYFVTPASVNSRFCRDELQFALNHKIKIIVVHLDKTELPLGLELSMGLNQALIKNELSVDLYRRRLLESLSSASAEKPLSSSLGKNKNIGQLIVVALSVVVVVAMGLVYYDWNNAPAVTPEPPEEAVAHQVAQRSIAVLPFKNRSEDPGNQHFSDGMAEDVINLLVRSNRIPVVAATSSFKFRDSDIELSAISNALKVTHVLLGSVRKAGPRIRVTAQFVNATTGVMEWSESFDRELTDVFAIQSEIAALISQNITGEANSFEPRISTNSHKLSTETWELYLNARYLQGQRTPEAVVQSKQLFEELVVVAPEFADGWYGLAKAYLRDHDIPAIVRERSRVPLEKALSLEPNHAKALARLSDVLAYNDFRWKDSTAMIEKAAKLAPTDAEVQRIFAIHLRTIGLERGLEVSDRAYRLDPLSKESVDHRVQQLFVLARADEAMKILQDYYSKAESFNHKTLADMYLLSGQLEPAKEQIDIAAERWGEDKFEIVGLRYRYALASKDPADISKRQARFGQFPLGEFSMLVSGNPEIPTSTLELAIEHRASLLAVQQLLLAPRPWRTPDDRKMLKQKLNFAEIEWLARLEPSYFRSEDERNQMTQNARRVDWDSLEKFMGNYPLNGIPATYYRRESDLWMKYGGVQFPLVPVGIAQFAFLDINFFTPIEFIEDDGQQKTIWASGQVYPKVTDEKK